MSPKATGWWEISVCFELLPDPIQHSIRILEHVTILQPQHRQAGGIQKSLAGVIPCSRRLAVVRGSFELDDQPLAGTIEIDNIRTDAVLPPEFPAFPLRVPEHAPQSRFGWPQTRAERAALVNKRAAIVESLRSSHPFD